MYKNNKRSLKVFLCPPYRKLRGESKSFHKKNIISDFYTINGKMRINFITTNNGTTTKDI